jgi:hypothetical protein
MNLSGLSRACRGGRPGKARLSTDEHFGDVDLTPNNPSNSECYLDEGTRTKMGRTRRTDAQNIAALSSRHRDKF